MMVENQYSLAPELLDVLKKFQGIAVAIGALGIAALAVGFFLTSHEQFLRSYLVGFIFWNGMALGSLVLMMIQYMTGGAWGMIARRTFEAASRVLPLMIILVLPILFGATILFPWTFPAALHDKVLQDKAFYLNLPGFYLRTPIYYIIWFGLMYLLNKWSLDQDKTGDIQIAKRLETLSGAGIVIFVFTGTLAAVDWLMALSPHWFSTIYGLLVMVGQVLSSLALVVATIVLMAGYSPLKNIITKRHLHDLGKLMLALTMLWAYLSFSQLILIWSGNLPEEISYYIDRLNGGWEYIGAGLLMFHFAFPFLMLLSQKLKKNPATISRIALYIIFVRLIDIIWLVEPNFGDRHLNIHWLDFATPVAIGGIWMAYFFYNLRQRPILPVNAPHLQRALDHGRHHH
jgi:hypothetical protein